MKLNEVISVKIDDIDPDDNFAAVQSAASAEAYEAIRRAISKGTDGKTHIMGYKVGVSFSQSGSTAYVSLNGVSVGSGSTTVNQILKKIYAAIKADLKDKFSKPTSRAELLQLQQDMIDDDCDMKVGPKSFTISKDGQALMTINYTIAA